jgi:EXLDI family protein
MQLRRAEMPNKTIYVADADLPIFERAQELAGENLSATIVHALRRLVAVEEAMARGLGEVILKVGNHGTYVNKAFMGRELARRRARDEPTHEIVSQVVYQTAKGRLVLYTRTFPAWFAWMSFWEDEDATPPRWSGQHDVDVDVNVDVDVSPGDDDPAVRRSGRQERIERQQRRRQDRRRQQEWWQQKGWSRDWSTWRADVAGNAYRMDIFETLEELKPHVAEELYNAVAQALRGEDVEFLDI